MSRSNPHLNAPNPAVRWFEWNGEKGVVRYYDKAAKENKVFEGVFTFLLLDELACVRGWDDSSQSGIYSNEVRDTTKDVLVVKTFKGGTIAEGYYKAIKDRVNTRGASFVASCYIATKIDGTLSLCVVRFKGAALSAWLDFRKANRQQLYESAIRITGTTEGKKGRIVYKMPVFELKTVTEETNRQALALDKVLQGYLDGYLKRTTHDQAETTDSIEDEQDGEATPEAYARAVAGPAFDDDSPDFEERPF